MEEKQKREFTGVWIPRHIIEDTRLKPAARLIYAEIASFAECTMSNETLAQRAGCSSATVKRIVAELKSYGYVRQTSFNGRQRKLTSLMDQPIETAQNELADSSNCTQQTAQNEPLDNNIENKEITATANAVPQPSPKSAPKPKTTSQPYLLTEHICKLQNLPIFPSLSKQLRDAKAVLKSYSLEDAKAAAERMQQDSYWQQKPWDMGNLARNIHRYNRDTEPKFIDVNALVAAEEAAERAKK